MDFKRAKSYINARLRKDLPGNLSYHSVAHVKDVYDSAKRLAKAEGIDGEDLTLLLTAVLFHDSGFMIQSKEHEKIGCDIVQEALPQFGYTPEQIERICGMIMATRIPQEPNNLLEEIIADADLDYLGRDDFWTIGNKLFSELQMYGILQSEEEWNKLQVGFLDKHHYFTKTAIATRKAKKDAYLAQLKKEWNM
jgi:exopolyphosphatase/pppGpp-phosphohydrolase